MFRFKLEFLKRYREQLEDTAMYELAQRIREANEIEADIQDLKDRRAKLAEETSKQAGAGVSGALYVMYRNYDSHLYRRGAMMEKGLARAEKRIEDQRKKLVAASVQRKIIDRFKEKQHEQYQEKEARSERMNLDELAALVKARKQNE